MLAVLSFTTIRNSLHTCATVKQSCYLVDPDSCLAFRVYTFQLISLTVWYSSCRYHTDITTLSFLCAPTTFQHSAHQSTRLELNHINQHAKHLLNFGQQHILLLPIRVHTFVSTYFFWRSNQPNQTSCHNTTSYSYPNKHTFLFMPQHNVQSSQLKHHTFRSTPTTRTPHTSQTC